MQPVPCKAHAIWCPCSRAGSLLLALAGQAGTVTHFRVCHPVSMWHLRIMTKEVPNCCVDLVKVSATFQGRGGQLAIVG